MKLLNWVLGALFWTSILLAIIGWIGLIDYKPVVYYILPAILGGSLCAHGVLGWMDSGDIFPYTSISLSIILGSLMLAISGWTNAINPSHGVSKMLTFILYISLPIMWFTNWLERDNRTDKATKKKIREFRRGERSGAIYTCSRCDEKISFGTTSMFDASWDNIEEAHFIVCRRCGTKIKL